MSRTARTLLLAPVLLAAAGVTAIVCAIFFGARPYTRETHDAHAPIGIVLGARSHRNGVPTPMLGDRIALAAALYRSGNVGTLLISGSQTDADPEVRTMRTELVRAGVPGARIISDTGGITTKATCKRAASVFHVRRAVVISQEFHIPRAIFLCRRAGIDVIGVGATDWDKYALSMPGHVVREWFADVKAVSGLGD